MKSDKEREAQKTGDAMMALIQELFPLCRSITGSGLRETLKIINAKIPLQYFEVPTGLEVLDWVVPKEWNIQSAYIADLSGKKIIDFKNNNLHVVNYSAPIRARMSFSDLKNNLYTLPNQPDLIPYRTSYYKESWGFCLSQNQLDTMVDSEYDVVIDSTLESGSLTYAEHFIQGESHDEVLISSHCCHPSLANDNLSGLALAVFLAQELAQKKPKLSYRFVFIPGTIGAITWLSQNPEKVKRIRHGLVLTGVGNMGPLTYKRSRQGTSSIDRVAVRVLKNSGVPFEIRDFSPYGYDERQYCSPGFNLPVGRLSRTPYGEYPEYHTSGDNLEFISAEKLSEGLAVVTKIVTELNEGEVYINTKPFGEVQLGKRGLYRSSGGAGADELALLWVLNLCDGAHSLNDISEQSGLPLEKIHEAKELLVSKSLLRLAEPNEPVLGKSVLL